MDGTRFVGLDVHKATITAAVAEPDGEVRVLGTIPNTPEAVARLLRKLGQPEGLRVCYEAGPCGYVLYWQLVGLGVRCIVVAPTLIPVKPGDRVKTDRRDAARLARSYRSGDLTPVWVPDAVHEALRDLVRAREAAKKDQLRARHRLQKLLLRQGLQPPGRTKAWTDAYGRWLETVHFEHAAREATRRDYLHEVDHARERVARLEQAIAEAVTTVPPQMRAVIAGLQTLRGMALLSAVTVVAELGRLSRFARARQLMGYSGAVSGEHSSGPHVQRGGITKTGNAHVRRIVVEAAWHYRHAPAVTASLRKRQVGQSAAVIAIAWKAQHRLHGRFRRLLGRGKPPQQVVTAVARELLGFIWAIGVTIERDDAAPALDHVA